MARIDQNPDLHNFASLQSPEEIGLQAKIQIQRNKIKFYAPEINRYLLESMEQPEGKPQKLLSESLRPGLSEEIIGKVQVWRSYVNEALQEIENFKNELGRLSSHENDKSKVN